MCKRSCRWWAIALIFLGIGLVDVSGVAAGARAVKTRVEPEYPAIARRLRLRGMVKLTVTVAPGGAVVSAKVSGGNPILAEAATDAVKKWRFEAGPEQTTETVSVQFGSD